MIKRTLLTSIALIVGVAALLTLTACDGSEQAQTPESKATAVEKTVDNLVATRGQTLCPIMGGKIDKELFVDKDGKLYQQVYGAVFEPPVIIEPLKDLVFGRYAPVTSVQGIIDRIKLFCTVYDPNSGRYIFDYSLFAGIAIALLCLGLVLAFLIREWRRPPPGRTGHA